jgi:prepilin-type N-terminal cleavage/methylation domain-containing protein
MRLSGMSGCIRKGRRSPFGRGQRGYALIEVLISIAIFGVISVAFLSALVAGYHGVVVAHDQTMAQSLTRTALENVRGAPYPFKTGSDNTSQTGKYDVVIHADNITTSTSTTPYVVLPSSPSNVQLITVTVRNHNTLRTIMKTQNLKVKP